MENQILAAKPSISAFPKIFALGHKAVLDIFKGPVEITEKADGSQFVFGVINNELQMRSKGKVLYMESHEKMFNEAVCYVVSLFSKGLLLNNMLFYAEYLQKPRHNVLAYNRVPTNNLMLFGIKDISIDHFLDYSYIEDWARRLGIDSAPLLFEGIVENQEQLLKFLEKESFLGGSKIEGFVIKNYSKQFLLGDQFFHVMSAKYVSEKFKEVHNKDWKEGHTGKGRFDLFKEKFRSEARWDKSIIHLREKGELEEDPKDIGKLMKEINLDIIEECKEEIKEFLWKEFGKSILRHSTKGFPEWYKEQLLKKAMDNI